MVHIFGLFDLSLGRLYQVEYAMEAIGHAGTCLGVQAIDGVVLAGERPSSNKLLDDSVFRSEKIYKLNEYVQGTSRFMSHLINSVS